MSFFRTEGSRALALAVFCGVSALGVPVAEAKKLPVKASAPPAKPAGTTTVVPVVVGGSSGAAAKEATPAPQHDPFWRLRQPRPAPVKQAEAPVAVPEGPRSNIPVLGGATAAPASSAAAAFKVMN